MIETKLFTEKYRPKRFEELIGNKEVESLKKIRENPFSLPHLLLVSKSPGTGKTSLANVIVNELKADYLKLNASDERGIDVIRNKIKEFASTVAFNRKSPKIVWLDEADGLTPVAQDSLRNILEDYSTNCRFIFTANYANRIIQPIVSRCQVINLSNPPKSKIKERLKEICEKENIKIESEKLEKLIENYYPDIRSMLKTLNEFKLFGNLNLDQKSVYKQIYELIKQKKFTKARKLWLTSNFDYREGIKFIFNEIMNDENLPNPVKKNTVYVLAEASYRMAVGADEEISFAKLVFDLMRVIKW